MDMSRNQQASALIEEIFKDEYEALIKYAYYALYGAGTGDRGRAEEAVQDAIVIALSNAEKFATSQNPRGWLVYTLRNTIQNTKRQELRIQKLLENFYYANDTAAENIHDIGFSLQGLLPAEDLALLEKVYIGGYSYKEMQAELNLSPSAFAMRISRLKAKFIKNYDLMCEKSTTMQLNQTNHTITRSAIATKSTDELKRLLQADSTANPDNALDIDTILYRGGD